MSSDERPMVVKVGGSLYDLPDLGPRLAGFLASLGPVVVVPGGGPAADLVRRLDQQHGLGEERSHWLALRAMELSAHFLQALLRQARVIDQLDEWREVIGWGLVPIVNAYAFAVADEDRPGALPHTWLATSDALAARVAVVARARELVLLKSTEMPADMDWAAAAEAGLVDPIFEQVLRAAASDLPVRMVNFRG